MGKYLQIVTGLWLALLPASGFAQTQPATQPAALVVLRGEIDDYNRDMLFRRFQDARVAGAKTVILQIDTYGGLVTAGLDISRFLKQQSDLHIIAFVHDKAISAGAMIALACNEIVMEPEAVIGDCAPIMFRTDGSLEAMPDAERGKAESPILADFRDSAQRNGYDPLVAEAMVSVDRVVHYIQSPDGVRRFVGQANYDKLISDGWKPVDGVPDPVDSAKSLLTVHTDIAAKIGLCRQIERSPDSLALSRNYQIVGTFAPAAGEKIIELLNSPLARMLLITLFIISIKLAFSTPGHGAPEAMSLITLGLLVGVPMLTGYAQWWEIVTIFIGLALLAFEIFVFPGHFVSGAIGALMVIGGLVMTFVPKEPGGMPGILPSLNGTYTSLQNGLIVVVSGMLCSLLLWLWLQRYLPKVPYFNRLVLTATSGGAIAAPAQADESAWPRTGMTGKAMTDLRPGGMAAFHDEAINDVRLTQVVSDSGFVEAETPVVVREVAGNRIVVRAAAIRSPQKA